MASPSLEQQRDLIRPLLDDASPLDAQAVYYALHHDPRRTALTVHLAPSGHTDGFLIRCQTGVDLFHPFVTFRAPDESAAAALFGDGLLPGRAVRLAVPESLAGFALRRLSVSDMRTLRLYILEPGRFQPEINVLVTSARSPDGHPRFEIRSGEVVQAAAGLNWRSPRFAEVYVHTEPAARGRGWGRSVLSALAGALIQAKLRPLYVVEEDNTASIRLAQSAGFTDTGHREIAGMAVLQA